MPNNAELFTGTLYGRYASVEVTNPPKTSRITIPNGLRMDFKCVKQAFNLAVPNTLELTLTNLSAQTRNELIIAGATVQLIAGYELAFGSIFKGVIRTVDHIRKGPDWDTVIKCGDGEIATAATTSRWTNSDRNLSKLSVIQALLDDLGLGNGNFNSLTAPFTIQKGINKDGSPKFIPAQTLYLHGFTVSGNTFSKMREVVNSLGYTVSIQNGQPQFAVIDEPAHDYLTYVLNPETGLLGSPTSGSPNIRPGTKKFGIVKAKCLMIPQIGPGLIIRMQHDKDKKGKYLSDGNYEVQKVEYRGDTAGNDWSCELELKPHS